MRGRGLLGRWGPNHAADPIVTRFHPETGQLQARARARPKSARDLRAISAGSRPPLPPSSVWPPATAPRGQMVAILRSDVQKWAIPGGMVKEGQRISATIRKDFEAEVRLRTSAYSQPTRMLTLARTRPARSS